MPSITELRERRNQLAADIERMRNEFQQRHDSGAEDLWPDNTRAEWDSVNAEFDDVSRQLAREQQADEVLSRYSEIQDSQLSRERRTRTRRQILDAEGHRPDDRAVAIGAWFRQQAGIQVSRAEREAAQRAGVPLRRAYLDIDLADTRVFNRLRAEQRVLTTGTGASGGYTIPEGFVASLEIAMLHYGPMLQVADVITTDSGNDLPWPTGDDTGNTGELLTAGSAVDDSNDDPTFGQMLLQAYPFSSRLVRVPVALLEDSAFDMAGTIGEMLGERLGRTLNSYATTGTGSSQPNGVVTASVAGKTAASTTAIADTELIDLQHSVDIAYRRDSAFMMHDAVLAAIRKLKDSDGRFLWSAGDGGLTSGPGGRLLDAPVHVNNDMASSIAASAKTVLFGDFRKVKIRRVKSIRIRRLVERYAEYDQEGFVALLRADVDVLNAGTNPIKHLVQKAS